MRLLARLRPHAINYVGPKAALLGALAAWILRIPRRVYTVGGMTYNARQPAWLRFVLKGVERCLSGLSTDVVFVAQRNRAKALAARVVPAAKAHVVVAGYELLPFLQAQSDRAALGWGEDEFVVLQVNNLKRGKNNRALIDIAARVRAAVPKARFVVAGDGEDRPYLASLEVLGWRSDIPRLMASADVVTLTSRYQEGLPQVCSQAMACAKPMVMMDNEGIGEELRDGDNGFLVAMDDHAHFAARIVQLAQDRERCRSMGARGRSLLNHDHDAAVSARKMAALMRAPTPATTPPHGKSTAAHPR
jgi:glycosyltransferase involved in cell wall biosynthesis